MVDLDTYLGIHSKALLVREQRAAQLAANLSNIDTPNYKAKDIDFKSALENAMGSSPAQMVTDHSAHINVSNHFSAQLKFREPNQISLDGNTVDKDLETMEFAKNALSYQASLSFLGGKIKSMIMAFRGE
ncbi:flagellar basal-body rod protein FlgB [Legionella birminghamensis]|uniref:Flagellar basal body rod protein FlgB n=1 Tax=Legionella birminghamensis TaxID=28083 RepID=A0A378IA83_9GAMM|nr:flagellar basal body rod protein FlgB [Legionella birminghamensis]KTC74678.1 flagellar basal-body rod protein FlgB [Legionella birminghamensis]STX31481.1 flagellar basal-body rod protein FlgB [Legionella birminghamensis]